MRKTLLIVLAIGLLCSSVSAAPKGNLKIAGSTTVLPLSQIWAEAFMNKHPGTSISVSGGGSGVGISSLLNGSCQIANASREAKRKEIDAAKSRAMTLVATKLAKDGLAIIVHSSNNVKNLTMAQLAGIYSGKITSWNQVGGDGSARIVVVGRDSSSGTYGFFQEAVPANRPYTRDMLAMPSNQSVAQAVAQSKDAVGYVGLAYAKDFAEAGKVRILSISRKTGQPGIVPSDKSVLDGSYPLFRYLFAYTLGKPRGLAGEFLKWCAGSEGQAMVAKSGYLPLK